MTKNITSKSDNVLFIKVDSSLGLFIICFIGIIAAVLMLMKFNIAMTNMDQTNTESGQMIVQ